MSFESYMLKGRISTLWMVLGTVISGFVSVLSLDNNLYISIIQLLASFTFLILFLLAMNGFAKYYADSKIFKNSLYSVIIAVIAGNIMRIIMFTFVTPILEESAFLTGLQVVAVLWVVTSIVLILQGIFYRRAFNALGEKSGEPNFKQAGEYMFFGGVLTIVLVGIIGFFIGWILAFKGFSSMKPKSSQDNSVQETPSN